MRVRLVLTHTEFLVEISMSHMNVFKEINVGNQLILFYYFSCN